MLIAHLLITYSLYTRIYWFRSEKSFNIILYSDWKIAIKILGKERKFHRANPYNYFQQTNHLFSFYLFIYLSIYIYPPAFVIPQSIFFHSANNLFLPFLFPPRANAVKNAKKRSEGQQISNCTTANRAILRWNRKAVKGGRKVESVIRVKKKRWPRDSPRCGENWGGGEGQARKHGRNYHTLCSLAPRRSPNVKKKKKRKNTPVNPDPAIYLSKRSSHLFVSPYKSCARVTIWEGGWGLEETEGMEKLRKIYFDYSFGRSFFWTIERDIDWIYIYFRFNREIDTHRR